MNRSRIIDAGLLLAVCISTLVGFACLGTSAHGACDSLCRMRKQHKHVTFGVALFRYYKFDSCFYCKSSAALCNENQNDQNTDKDCRDTDDDQYYFAAGTDNGRICPILNTTLFSAEWNVGVPGQIPDDQWQKQGKVKTCTPAPPEEDPPGTGM